MEHLPLSKKLTALKAQCKARLACKRTRYSLIALLVCALVAVSAVSYYYLNREIISSDVLLLTGQSYELPEAGSVSLDTSQEDTQAPLTYDDTTRTVTAQTKGTVHVQVHDFLTIYSYTFSIISPKPQATEELTLNVDQSQATDSQPFIIPAEWSSSDETIATVQDGVITALSSGSCTITETLNDFLTYTYTVTVLAPEVEQTSFQLYPDETLSIPIENYDGEVKWKLKGDSVALQKDGSFLATKAGKTTLTTSIGNDKISVTVNVSEPLSTPEQVDLSLTLHTSTQIKPENALGIVTYHTNNPTVATVDKTGLITPTGVGSTQIQCQVRNQTTLVNVNVTEYTPLQALIDTNYGDYQPKDATIGALVMLGMCAYYNDTMVDDDDKWYNSNTTDISHADTFDEMTDASKKGANCNKLTNWSLKDMGLFPTDTSGIYGDSDNMIHYYNNHGDDLKSRVDTAFTVHEMDGDDLSEFIDELKPGDVLFGHIHTFIYRGENTLFCSAGDAKHYNSSHGMVFVNWLRNAKDTYNWSRPVYWMMRYKESYIPQYYRNKDGDITTNPVYLAQSNPDPSAWLSDELRAQILSALSATNPDLLVDGKPLAQ